MTPFMATTLRRALAVAVLGALITACTPGGEDLADVRREINEGSGSRNSAAANVKPPPEANPKLTARVGLILATNSRTWSKLLGASSAKGVAVLFVQPGGPGEKAAVKKGDVVTKVGDETVANAERAVVALRAKPKEKKNVSIVRSDGSKTTVAITAEVPGNVDLVKIYSGLIDKAPEDAVLRFLRAQVAGVKFEPAMADVEKAVELSPGFVEAVSLRAELLWNKSRDRNLDQAKVEEFRDRAMSDWGLAARLDPDNTRVLVSRAQALTVVGSAASAKRDAVKARDLDKTFPGAWYSAALADYVLGKVADSAAPARRAIDLNPYDVRYYRMLAVVFVKLGRKQDAQKTVDAIVDLIDDRATREDLLRVVEGGAP